MSDKNYKTIGELGRETDELLFIVKKLSIRVAELEIRVSELEPPIEEENR